MLPLDCVKAEDLHALARAFKRLESFHERLGGTVKAEPCLRSILQDRYGRITASVQSGDMLFKLVLKDGEWKELGNAIKG